MSGSGKPGSTFKATVTASSGNTAIIQGGEEDIAYLVTGTTYIFNVTPIGNGGHGGGAESSTHKDA